MKVWNFVGVAGLIVMLSACSTTPEIDLSEGSAGSGTQVGGDTSGLPTGSARTSGVEVLPIGDTQGFSSETLGAGQTLEGMTPIDMDRTYSPVVYFGFDQFAIDEDSMMTLRYYSEQLLNKIGRAHV